MFTITIPKMDEQPKGPGSLVADRRLYIAADERTLVAENSRDAAWLLVPTGGVIHGADVARLGLSIVDGRVVQDAPAPVVEVPADAPATEPEKVEAPADAEKVDADAKPTGKREKK